MHYDKQVAAEIISKMRPQATWTEIALTLNKHFGLDCDESTYRKGYSAKESEALRAVKLEKQYLRYERAKNYEDIRDITLRSMFTDELRQAVVKTAPKVDFARQTNLYETTAVLDEFVFVTSDFHYDGDETLLEHLGTVYAHIMSKQKQHGFSHIKLLELGDTIDGGALRVSQLMAIKKGMVFQIIDVAKAYTQMLNALSETMDIEFYCITSSNHTQLRPLGTKQNQLVEEDLMHVFAEYVALAIASNRRIKMQSANELVVNVTPNHAMFIAHGHLIGNKKEGYLQELAFHRGLKLDYGLFGHFHHYREITLYNGGTHNKKVFYAPSMSTQESQYELDKNLSSKPAILMMRFNNTTGHRYSEELFI